MWSGDDGLRMKIAAMGPMLETKYPLLHERMGSWYVLAEW
jgi:hypothetical protein